MPTRSSASDDDKIRDELGDVLFQVVFLSLLLEERGAGSLTAVIEEITAKLIRRHPHVFAESEARELLEGADTEAPAACSPTGTGSSSRSRAAEPATALPTSRRTCPGCSMPERSCAAAIPAAARPPIGRAATRIRREWGRCCSKRSLSRAPSESIPSSP